MHPKDSRQRITELLKNKRFTVTEEGQILNKDSLLALYDPKRRHSIEQLITACGFGLRFARVEPAATFRNFQFDSGESHFKSRQ